MKLTYKGQPRFKVVKHRGYSFNDGRQSGSAKELTEYMVIDRLWLHKVVASYRTWVGTPAERCKAKAEVHCERLNHGDFVMHHAKLQRLVGAHMEKAMP